MPYGYNHPWPECYEKNANMFASDPYTKKAVALERISNADDRNFLAEAEAELAHLDEYQGIQVPTPAEPIPWSKYTSWGSLLAVASVPYYGQWVVAGNDAWGGFVVATSILVGCALFVRMVFDFNPITTKSRLAQTLTSALCGILAVFSYANMGKDGQKGGYVQKDVTVAQVEAQPTALKDVGHPIIVADARNMWEETPAANVYPWPDVKHAIDGHDWYGGNSCIHLNSSATDEAAVNVERDQDGVTLTLGSLVYRVKSVYVDKQVGDFTLHSFLVEGASGQRGGRMYASRAACLLANQAKKAENEKQNAGLDVPKSIHTKKPRPRYHAKSRAAANIKSWGRWSNTTKERQDDEWNSMAKMAANKARHACLRSGDQNCDIDEDVDMGGY